MTKLEEARLIIDECDKVIKDAYLKRMEAVKLVALYKKENNLNILDEKREKEIIERKSNELKDSEYKDEYLKLINSIMTISKEYQEKIINE